MNTMKVTVDAGGKESTVDLGIVDRPAPIEPTTIEDVKERGVLSDREIADAKRHNLISERKAPAAPAPDPEKPPVPPVVDPEKPAVPPASAVKIEDLLQENPDPAKEAAAMKDWSKNEQALYWGRKKAVRRAQRAEKAVAEKDAEIADLRKKLAAKTPADEADPLGGLDDPAADPEKTPPADPNKPTPEQVAEFQRKRVATLNEQEADFQSVHADFPQVYDLTSEILSLAEKGDDELATLFPNALERRGVKSLLNDFIHAAAVPHAPGLKKLAPEIAYEIGNLHPKRQKPNSGGKPADPAPSASKKAPTVDEPPPSSGSANGGSAGSPKRLLDMTPDEFLALSSEKHLEIKARYPKEYEALRRSVG